MIDVEHYRQVLERFCLDAAALLGVVLLGVIVVRALCREVRRFLKLGLVGMLVVGFGVGIAFAVSARKTGGSSGDGDHVQRTGLVPQSGQTDAGGDDSERETEEVHLPALAFESIDVLPESVRLGLTIDPLMRFADNRIYLGATSDLLSPDWWLIKEIELHRGRSDFSVEVLKSEYPEALSDDRVMFKLVGEIDEYDPTSDQDHDGVSDVDEDLYGSDPCVADTDGDGICDGDEIVLGTDPTNADSDGDGISDYDEVQAGTNPVLNLPPLVEPGGDHYELVGANTYTTVEVDDVPEPRSAGDPSMQGESRATEVIVPGITYNEPGQNPKYHRIGTGMSIRALHTGRFSFKLLHADDIVNVTINGMTVTGDYYGDKPESSTILIAGETYPIEIESWNRGGPARLSFEKFAEFTPVPRIAMDARFTKAAVIFEEAYRNSPTEFVPKKSTKTTLRIPVSGGTFGGTVSIQFPNMGPLRPVSYIDFDRDGELIPAGTETRVLNACFDGRKRSRQIDDAEVVVTFVENMTGDTLVQTARVTSVMMQVVAGATWPQNKIRHVFGPYESASIELYPSMGDARWNLGAAVETGRNVDYVAEDHETTIDCAVQARGAHFSFPMRTIGPKGFNALTPVAATDSHWQSRDLQGPVEGQVGVGLYVTLRLLPDYVNFSHVYTYEGECGAVNGWGRFAGLEGGLFWHDQDHGSRRECETGAFDNEAGDDLAGATFSDISQPWTDGGFEYHIPQYWQARLEEGGEITGEGEVFAIGVVTNRYVFYSSGDLQVDKFGCSAIRSTNGVSRAWR